MMTGPISAPFDLLVSSVEDYAIFMLDPAGCVSSWNPGAERIKGYAASEIIGRSVRVFYSDEDNATDKPLRLLRAAEEFGSVEDEGWRLRKDGTRFWAHVSISALRNPAGVLLAFAKITADQTKRRNIEEELRDSERRFSTAFEYAAVGMALVGLDGRFLRVNRAYAEMLGYSQTELLNLDFQTITHPDDLDADLRQAHLLLDGRITSYHMEKRYLCKNGEVLWVLLSGSLVRDELDRPKYFIAQAQDITKRRKALENLKEQTVLLGAVIDSMGNGLIVATPTEFLLMNKEARRLFGDNPGQTDKEDWPRKYGLFLPDQQTLFKPQNLPLAKAMLGESSDETEMWIRNAFVPDGVWIRVLGRPLSGQTGVVRGGIVVFRDVTVQKKMEAELEVSHIQAASNARLSALGMMAGGIAHEINNPLGIIHGAADNLVEFALQHDPPLDPVLKNANRVLDTSKRIARIVKSLRQIAREGSSDPFRVVSLRSIVEETLELCVEKFRSHSVQLQIANLDPRLLVRCREVQIAQVLLNLLLNAYDAVVEKTSGAWVGLEVEPQGEWVCVSVLDNGVGIPVADRQRIMEPFYTTKPVGKGTGLGLSISGTIIEEHGGKVVVGEKSGHTAVSFTIPLARVES